MRLGLLGPLAAGADETLLERAAELLLSRERAHRVIYLGNDGAMERVVAGWARRIVGDDPTDEGAWSRAARVAKDGDSRAIDAFVATERHRLKLRVLESLPPRVLRTIEMVGDRIAVIVHDKACLDEEDIFAANLLVFGKSEAPLVKKIGARSFLSPGLLGGSGSKGGGVAVLDDAGDDIALTIGSAHGELFHSEMLVLPKGVKMSVQ